MSAPEELSTSAQLREANDAIEQLQHEIDDADQKYVDQAIELDMVRQERNRLKQQVDPLASRAEQLTQDLAASQADLTRAEKELTEAMAMLGSVVHERNNAQALAATRLERIGAAREGLERVAAERDGVREELARQAAANEDLEATLAMRTGQLREAREHAVAIGAELVSARTELVLLRDLRDHLRAQINQLSSWQVFRGGEQLVCVPCGGPIERGQAVEPVPGGDPAGSTKGQYAHVHCPQRRAQDSPRQSVPGRQEGINE